MPMRGAKWLKEATYLTDADREKIMQEVAVCKIAKREEYERQLLIAHHADTSQFDRGVALSRAEMNNPKHVGVRVPSYIGEPHPIAVITYGPGGCNIWNSVYH